MLAAEVGGEAVVGDGAHAGLVAEEVFDEPDAAGGAQEAFFLDVVAYSYDDMVEQGESAPDDVFVAGGEGIEGAGENGFFLHKCLVNFG